MPFCGNCGYEMKDGNKFCPKCGTPVLDKEFQSKSRSESKAFSEKRVKLCPKCGDELIEGKKFCANCGYSTEEGRSKKRSQREISFEGELHKCPNCGEIINSFSAFCTSCGYEIRDRDTSDSIKEFSRRLSEISSKNAMIGNVYLQNQQIIKEKVELISNYPVPNTKEDILEFMIMADSNINSNYDRKDVLSQAWIKKNGADL